MSELAHVRPAQLDRWRPDRALEAYMPRDLVQAREVAEGLWEAGVVPGKNWGEALAIMMQGARFGLDPISAHRAFFVDTKTRKIGVFSDALRGLVEASGLCEAFDLVEDPAGNGNTCAVFLCRRPGRPEVRVGFSRENAETAGLWGKRSSKGNPTPWTQYPDRMLIARAAAKAARLVWPDVCGGMYTRDEMSAGDAGEAPALHLAADPHEDADDAEVLDEAPARKLARANELEQFLVEQRLGWVVYLAWRFCNPDQLGKGQAWLIPRYPPDEDEKARSSWRFRVDGTLQKLRDASTGRLQAVEEFLPATDIHGGYEWTVWHLINLGLDPDEVDRWRLGAGGCDSLQLIDDQGRAEFVRWLEAGEDHPRVERVHSWLRDNPVDVAEPAPASDP